MPVQLDIAPSSPFQRFSTSLDEVPYIFDLRWNGRMGVWFMDLYDAELNLIFAGEAVVLGKIIGMRSTHEDLPLGGLIAADLSNSGRDATLDDLGSRVVVYYLTKAELDAVI